MATFTDIKQVKTFKLYKAALKTALAKVKAGTPMNFAYIEKFAFDDKERMLVLVDHQPELAKEDQLGKKALLGKVTVNAADKLAFKPASGQINFDKLVKVLAEVGVPRAVAHPDDKPDAQAQEPDATQLKMRYGWSEMGAWGDEAKELIDAFDGLVGVYRGLPEVKPAWKELVVRHEEVKEEMAAMVKTKIYNDKDVRLAKLEEVKALVKKVRHLATDLRTKAQEEATPKVQAAAKPQASQASAQKPVDKPATTTPTTPTTPTTATQEPPKPATKTPVTAEALTSYVSSTPGLGGKDTIEKYVARAQRALEAKYANLTTTHLDVLKRLAARYYASAETVATPTARPTTPAPVIDWATRVLDTSGAQADLSGFDATMRNKIIDIAQTNGRNDHGGTVLSGSHGTCLHWRLGDMRIFGNIAGDNFTLIGTGRHSGKGNSNYKVELLLGGTATATTG